MNQVEVKRRRIIAFSYIIGLINICIFGKMLGNNGITYLVAALECFSFFMTVTTGNLSDTLGRILRGRNAKGQYKNAQNIRKRAMLLHGVTGMAVGILFAVCAGMTAGTVFGIQHSISVMTALAPAIFLGTVSTVLAGYFRGEGEELPPTAASVLRQFLLMGFGILFVNLLKNYGEKVSNLLGNEAYTAMYGGIGVAVAIDLTELLVLLLLILLFWKKKRTFQSQTNEGMKRTESFMDTIRILYGTRGIPVLLSILAQLPIWLGVIFYRKSMTDAMAFADNYGMFAGKYLVICGFAVLPAAALMLGANARTASFLRRDEQRFARSCFHGGLQAGIAFTMFFSVYVAMMAQQLSGVFCGTESRQTTLMLQQGSAMIMIVTLGLYFSRFLLLTGKQYHVLGCLGGMNILFIIVLSVSLNAGKAGIMSLIYASLAAGGVYCLALGFFCCRILGTGIDWLRVIVMPLLMACLTGMICLLLGKIFTPHLGNLVTVIVALVVAVVVYWTGLLLMRCFAEQDLKYIPGGRLIHAIGQMFRVF